MSFTFDPNTNLGKLRALIGDTLSSSSVISDEDLNVFLSMTTNGLYESAALAARALALKYATSAVSKTAGNYSEDRRGISQAYLALAERFDGLAASVPADAQVEIIYNDFNYNQILKNKSLRGESFDE